MDETRTHKRDEKEKKCSGIDTAPVL